MILGEVFQKNSICVDLGSNDKDELFEELVELYATVNGCADKVKILQTVQERESKMTTGIGSSIAVPHGRCDACTDVHGVIGISQYGIDYGAMDDMPVHLVFLIISPVDDCGLHLRVLKRLAQLLQNKKFVKDILAQKDSESVHRVLCEYEDELSSL
ncbi:MAG: PTS sugar transporter subunit IIA [Treponemataceae bacterium]